MSFDVAYAQYQAENDKLEVFISDDCGVNWTNMYSKSGSALSTRGPVTTAFVPTATQWRKEVISLAGYSGDVLVKFVATSAFGNNLYLDNVNLSQCASQTITATALKEEICKGESLKITAGGATSYSWSSGQSTATIVITPTSAATYTYEVTSNDPGTCKNSALFSLVVNPCTSIQQYENATIEHNIYPNPNNGDFILNATLSNKETHILIFNTIGEKVYTKELISGRNEINASLAKGVYYYELRQSSMNMAAGKLIVQ
jgi:hypothetical protein